MFFKNIFYNLKKIKDVLFIILHFLIIFLPILNIFFSLIIIYEIIFFVIINRINFKKILKIFIFIIIIFILNTIFIDGKIVFKISNFYITYEGILHGIKKSSIFLTLFFFTSNIFYFKEYFLNIIPKNNLFFDSLLYFNEFLSLLNKKFSIKLFLINILRIYKKNNRIKEISVPKTNITILVIYNLLIIPVVLIIFALKNQLKSLLNF